MNNKILQSMFAVASAVLWFLPAFAGEAGNLLKGGLFLEQGYDSNIYRDNTGEKSEWTSTASPVLIFTRSEEHNNISLRYAPRAVYSYRTEKARMNHSVSGGYDADLAPRLHFNFNENYLQAEEPYSDLSDENLTGLSDKRGKSRYWANTAISQVEYEYAKESSLTMGYQNQVLENNEAGVSDFVRHSPKVDLKHAINQQWIAGAGYRFIRGDFDKAEDLTTNSPYLDLFYIFSPFTSILGHYGYSQTEYDGTGADYNSHTLAAGMDHRFSPDLTLEILSGVSMLRLDGSDANALYLHTMLNKRWEKSSWSLSADSGFDEQQFSGVEDRGLSRYWDVGSKFLHTYMDVDATVGLGYREDEYLERPSDKKEQEFRIDIIFAYSFLQWYQFSIRYLFTARNADAESNSYDDHRVFAGLSAEKDLMKW